MPFHKRNYYAFLWHAAFVAVSAIVAGAWLTTNATHASDNPPNRERD